jgi:hypothetical protein
VSRRLAGQAATLRLEGERGLAGTIESGDRRGLTLVLPVAPDRSLRNRDAVVEFVSPLGVHRIFGRVIHDPARAEVLHLTRAGGEVVQRREWVRVDAALPVLLSTRGGVLLAYTRNLSAGGMLVQNPLATELGELVDFALRLDEDGDAVPGRGPVTALRERGELMAVRFDELATPDRERIVQWVTDRQRLALRWGR